MPICITEYFRPVLLSINVKLQYFLKQIKFCLIHKYETQFIIVALEFILTCICSASKSTNKMCETPLNKSIL